MKKYMVEGTKSSPAINLDPVRNIFEIRGESYPENCWAFYKPMFEWLENYFANAEHAPIMFDMEILYFNSSSSKTFMDFFDLLDEQSENGREVIVNWRYHEENETAMECGEEFMEDVSSIKFNLVDFGD
ncbi:DUF1987 domain-containing protein [Desulfovibrio sp. JC022]|uniref:DUF1987 domain-containing protein n=1 Tax=Desulfovibrio sp. JC022 TaxID=2593642 RepID=UPI0013D24696|nr:DUF1987 domain-containing protein [Desulfovibrio sp. JC022]NDV24944.1 DUF1987 domain-containing protein [Desulfovibrio sp. JC022]